MLATLRDSEVECRHDSAWDPQYGLTRTTLRHFRHTHVLYIRVAFRLQGSSTINKHMMKLNERQKQVSVSWVLYKTVFLSLIYFPALALFRHATDSVTPGVCDGRSKPFPQW